MNFIFAAGLCHILTNQFIKWTGAPLKSNYRGEKVKNSGGVVIALTILFMAFFESVTDFDVNSLLLTLGALTIAFVGLLDDVFGEGGPKGLKGHLLSLANLEMTTGALKAIIGVTVAITISVYRGGNSTDIVINAALIAFSINLLNLLDLRPGRACKFFILAWSLALIIIFFKNDRFLLHTFSPVAAATMIFFKYDAGEILMLGDVGANVLGLYFGIIYVWVLPMKYKLPLTVFVIAANLISERCSFTSLIEKTPILNYIDTIGRRSQQK